MSITLTGDERGVLEDAINEPLTGYANASVLIPAVEYIIAGRIGALERLRDGVAGLHDMYAVAPNEPKCCSDCAANDISGELRRLLRDA